MTDNLALWEKLGKTDPAHTKGFKRGGGFSGTAIKPMWSYKRMTEEFGPCGAGWGVGEPVFQVVPGDNREVLVYCTASIWYGEDRKTVYGVGGDKIVTHIKANAQYNRPERWENDDEAFKKAFTDAITNALKMIGVGADVHMGMFDDSKYVNDMREEFREDAPAKQTKADDPKPVSAAAMKRGLDEIERELLDCESIVAVEKCAAAWRHIIKRDGWSRDYIAAAGDKFNARKAALTKSEAEDVFPGDTPGRVNGTSGNAYLDNYSAG